MSLTFFTGSAGSGKTHCMYNEIIRQSLAHPQQNYLLLVPEQFTMASQAEITRRHPDHVIMNVDVLSFNRLAYRVFDELGIQTATILEDTGKNLLLRQVAAEHEDELGHLRGLLRRPGYIDEMKSLLTEFMQYRITPDDVAQMNETPGISPSFAMRQADILVMYRGFLQAMEGRFITAEDLLAMLAEHIPQSRYAKNLTVFCDGFTGFTPLQMDVMEQLLSLAREVTVAVTLDPAEDAFLSRGEQELFAMSKTMIRRLSEAAKRCGCPVMDPVRIDGCHEEAGVLMDGRFLQGGKLSFLEQNLFRDRGAVYTGEAADEIRLCRLRSLRSELAFAAASVRDLVRTKGYRWRQIAVVCPDLASYGSYAEEIFDEYGIPLFCDRKAEVLYHPLTELVRSAFGLIAQGFSYESVLGFLRCGLTGFEPRQIDRFDNYIYAAGIRGWRAYTRTFERLPQGMTPEDVARADTFRAGFADLLSAFVSACQGKQPVHVFSDALRDLLVSCKAEEQLKEMAARKDAQGRETDAAVCRQIYGRMTELLEKTDTLLSEEVMDAAEYLSLLESGMAAMDIGSIPASADTVILGDLERTRLEGIRALFLLGAGNNAIPAVTRSGGFLTQAERQALKDADWELAPTDREKSFMQRFYLYLTLTRPSDLLVVTYPSADGEGKEVAPSYLIHTLQNMFDGLQVEYPETADPLLFLSAEEPALDSLAARMREAAEGEPVSGLLTALYAQATPEQKSRLLAAARSESAPEGIGPFASGGSPLASSVSRLEQFAACPYAYFLDYELKLRERKEYALEAPDLGNVYHAALYNYAEELKARNLPWNVLSQEESEAIADRALSAAIEKEVPYLAHEDAGLSFAMKRVRATLDRTFWALTEQVRRSSFEPQAFELSFGSEAPMRVELEGGHSMRFSGKVDRMDVWEGPDATYLKIMDYKSSSHKLDYTAVYYGRQLQLPLYMNAATELMAARNPGRDVRPAGLLYYHIADPILSVSADQAGTDHKGDILRQLRPEGLINGRPEILRAMDAELMDNADEGITGVPSDVIRVTLKKDGTPDAHSRVASEEELQLLQRFVRRKLIAAGNEIVSGRRPARPYRQKKKNGCEYCDYRAVCGFDLRLPGYGYCDEKPMKKDEWMERAAEFVEENL